MGGFFFVYTMLILVVCLGASFLQFAAAGATRKRSRVVLALFFFLYFCDLGCIFLEEFLSQNTAFPAHEYYEIANPVARTAVSTLLFGSLWGTVLTLVDRLNAPRLAAPTALFLCAQVLCLTALPYGALRQFCYYTLRQVFLGAMGLYGLWCYRQAPSDEERLVLAKLKPVFLAGLAFAGGILLEDVLVILVLSPDAASALPLYLSERNFIENMALLTLAYYTGRRALDELQFRLRQAPAPLVSETGDAVFDSHVGERMPRFCQSHGLTSREQEVLELVLQGKTNNEMAEELFLSVGTVKTHVHNIMKKVGSGGRDELRKTF